MEQELPLVITRRDDVICCEVRGDVTILSEPYFAQAYEQMRAERMKKVLLLFSGDVYINSGGIVALSQFLIRARTENRLVAIAGLSDHFKKIFAMVGISKVAHICDTPEQALQEMAAADGN